jgi:hypothetical protein
MNSTDPSDPRMSNCGGRSPNLRQLGTRHRSFGTRPSPRLAASAFRFVDELPAEELATLWRRLHSGDLPVEVNRQQRELVLMANPTPYATKRKRLLPALASGREP